MRYAAEPPWQHGAAPRTAVLLCNLGTPESPTPAALRRYLAEFLADPRVVEIPRALWWPILHGIVLRTRPRRSAAKYARIWLPEGSPHRLRPSWMRHSPGSACPCQIPRSGGEPASSSRTLRHPSS